MTPILEAENLTKSYPGFALKSISLEIPPGCISGFFGPTGAGKTTLMKILARQIPADSGTVKILGLGYDEAEKEIKNRLGYVPQEPVVYQERSVDYNAGFASSFFARWDGSAFNAMLEEFNIDRWKAVKRLSRGQKTLFSIALALSHGAELLILDEPTAGLDVLLRRSLLERLRAFVEDGNRTVVVASHITDGLEDIAEYVNFMKAGRLTFRSEKDELMGRWKRIHFREGALPPDLVQRLADVRAGAFGSSGLTGDYLGIRELLETGVARGDIKVENVRLDDILIVLHQGE